MINKLLKIHLLGLSLLFSLLSSAPAQAQAKLGPAAIKTGEGFLFVINSEDDSLLLEIKGKKVEPLRASVPMFMVDGKLVQIVTAEIKNFVDDPKKLTDVEILEKHKVWESDYLGEQYGGNLQVQSELLSVNNTNTLFWNFKRKKANENFDRDCFLTRVLGKNILALSSPIKPGESLSDYKTLLIGIMETLKVSDKPVDVLKIAEDFRKSAPKENKPPQQ